MSLASRNKLNIGQQRHRAANSVKCFTSQKMMISNGSFNAPSSGKKRKGSAKPKSMISGVKFIWRPTT
jgi:hypothetical protein